MELNISEKIEITTNVKKKAREIGFDLIGITTAEPFDDTFQLILNRELSEFINPDKRLLTKPGLLMKNAKTIISLALSYASSEVLSNDDSNIALYARGKDYHLVMKEMMSSLENYIKTLYPEAKTTAYSDTGPLLDREIAQRAGLGWIGKSNNLINPIYGSFLILGEIITNLEFLYDKETENLCGDCNLCLKYCPGGALEKAYFLNYHKCISYLTQKKGILDHEERKKINNNLWGCDKCLQVCPYNQGIPVNLHQEFAPVIKADVDEILNFTEKNINKNWRTSALYWRGIKVLKRNAIINIGNSAKNEYIPVLLKQLSSKSPLIRAYAIWALGEIDILKAHSAIDSVLEEEKEGIVIAEIKKIQEKKE